MADKEKEIQEEVQEVEKNEKHDKKDTATRERNWFNETLFFEESAKELKKAYNLEDSSSETYDSIQSRTTLTRHWKPSYWTFLLRKITWKILPITEKTFSDFC